MGINEANVDKTELELMIHTFIFILHSSSSVIGTPAPETVPGQEGPSVSSDLTAHRPVFNQIWAQITQSLVSRHC